MSGISILVAGCGGPAKLTGAERTQALETVRAYADGLAERNGVAACATLTPEMRRRHEPTCPQRIVRLDEFERPTRVHVKPELRDDGSVHGIVRYTTSAGLSGGTVTLRRVGGRWLIDEDLSCLMPGCDP